MISSQRGAEVTHQLLLVISERWARAVVLDLTGVDDVDPAVAELLCRITHEGLGLGAGRVYADLQAALAALR